MKKQCFYQTKRGEESRLLFVVSLYTTESLKNITYNQPHDHPRQFFFLRSVRIQNLMLFAMCKKVITFSQRIINY